VNWLRRWLHPETPPPGFRGTYCAPEVGLPDGFVLPSAALVPRAEGEIIGYKIDGKLHHPADVEIIRVAP